MLTVERLFQFAKTLDGETLETTARKKQFRLRVSDAAFEYTPVSTGYPRLHPRKWIERVLDRYNNTGSLRPGDYQDISANASYLLTIIQMLLADPASDMAP